MRVRVWGGLVGASGPGVSSFAGAHSRACFRLITDAPTPHRSQVGSLEDVARAAADRINVHVTRVLLSRYQLERHCTAIKRYLLLGQGDFIQVRFCSFREYMRA